MYVNKKPLNTIEYPVLPFIQKDPPRFYKTQKHWSVNVGDITRNQSTNTQLYDNSVLAVSRDENKYRYGARSYHPKVNKEFRPPLIDPEYDTVPLSRIPRPRTQVRLNPKIAESQNIHGIDVSSKIDERKLHGNIRPTYNIAYEKPLDYQHYSLSYNRPQVFASSGVCSDYKEYNDVQELDLKKRTVDAYGISGMNTPLEINGEFGTENIELNYNRPQASVLVNPGVQGSSTFNSENSVVPKLINPIHIAYTTNKQVNFQQDSFNKYPFLKPTLQYNRNCDSGAVIPTSIHNLNIKLKDKKGV